MFFLATNPVIDCATTQSRAFNVSATASLTLEHLTLTNCGSASLVSGGAIYSFEGSLALSNCIFSYNQANVDIGGGGAVYVEGGSLTVASTSFTSNSGCRGGAIYVKDLTTLTIQNVLFLSNTAIERAGALEFVGSSALNYNIITDSNFTDNSAPDGSIYVTFGQLFVNNTGFYSNSVSRRGGAITVDNVALLHAEVC